jgi:hypothetical protein
MLIRTLFYSTFMLWTFSLSAADPHRNYSWALLKDSSSSTCLQEYNGHGQFRDCVPSQSEQKWVFTPDKHFRFRFGNGHMSDECLDIPSESRGVASTSLQLWGCNDSPTMKWELEPIQGSPSPRFRVRSSWSNSANMCVTNSGKNLEVKIEVCRDGDPRQVIVLSSAQAKNQDTYGSLSAISLLDAGITPERWMELVYGQNPDTLLKDVIIPGTHDSSTFEGFSAASTTQHNDIYHQLKDGIRYVDLRIDVRAGRGLVVTHGIENGPQGSVDKIFGQIQAFAQTHPREILFVDMHEIPQVKDPLDDQGKKNVKSLANLVNLYFGSFLVTHEGQGPMNITFKRLWDAQDNEHHGHNIILQMNGYNNFLDQAPPDLRGRVWNKADTSIWRELWPNSTTFGVIESRDREFLQKNASSTSWNMSQLIRTPRVGDTIMTILGAKGGPFQLTSEKTDDGYFSFSISKWINDWVTVDHLKVNFVETDFYDLSDMVSTAILRNLMALCEKTMQRGDLKSHPNCVKFIPMQGS